MTFLAIIGPETIKVGPFYSEKFSQGQCVPIRHASEGGAISRILCRTIVITEFSSSKDMDSLCSYEVRKENGIFNSLLFI